MSYTLICIDMQGFFQTSHMIEKECNQALREAIKDRASILMVEYADCGRSLRSIRKTLDGYRKAFTVLKSDDDGANALFTAIEHYRTPSNKIKFIGVNTDACVYETANSLKEYFPDSKFEIIANACNAESETNHKTALKCLKNNGFKIRNIKLRNN
jgi:hypothetical protein